MLACKRLRIDSGDGYPVVEYRIENGRVENRIVPMPGISRIDWQPLTPEQLSVHVKMDTVVARWLSRRMGVFNLLRACNEDSSSPNSDPQDRSQTMAA